MRFGADMRGRASHDALLRIQDAEIRLLDTIQHFISMRVENDRKYMSGLNKMLHATFKTELLAEYKDCCSIFKAWDVIMKETESLSKTLKLKTEHLSSTTMDTLSQLIIEKKAARRKYQEERQRLNSEFNKVQDDVTKQRIDYQKCVERLQYDKARVLDLHTKGKAGPKLSEAKSKYVQSVVRLHKQHNDYILAVHTADQHQTMMVETSLPAVLDWHQERQEALVHKTKYLLDDLLIQMTPCDEELQNIGHTMKAAVGSIKPGMEYSGTFVELHRSSCLPPMDISFDEKLLDEYKGSLKASVLEVNDLTFDNLQARLKKLTDEMSETKAKLSHTNAEQQRLLVDVSMMSSTIPDTCDLEIINSYLEKKLQCDHYAKDLQEGEGMAKKLENVLEVIKEPLDNLGDKAPPTALDVHDICVTDGFPSNADTTAVGLMGTNTTGSSSNIGVTTASITTISTTTTSTTTNSISSSSISNTIKDTHFIKSLSKMKNPFKKGKNSGSSSSQGNNHDDEDSVSNISNEDNSPDKLDVRSKKHMNSYERSDPFLKTTNGSEMRTSMMMMLEEGQIMDMDASDAKERMADEEWFHGVLPREEVQRLLVSDGDFLVRESKNKRTHETQFVLSVFWQGHRHFIIQFAPDRGWHFEGQAYPTIQELVRRQHESRLPVTSKSGTILEKPILREWELLNDDIALVMRIGTGNFGEVFKGLYKKTQEVAVKTCKDTLTEDQKIKFLQEGRILKHYHHPNIVRYIGIAAQKQPVMIVMEFIANGALLQYLKTQGDTQTTASLLQMCVDAASGMSYLARRGCIHRDLAARNCLVGENNIIKISDFGMSREEEEYTVSTGMKQIPVKWTAPEALNYVTKRSPCYEGTSLSTTVLHFLKRKNSSDWYLISDYSKYTSLCDVWSFGVLMWEVFSRGRSPYSGMTNAKARQWVEQGNRLEAPQGTPASVYELMRQCWAYRDEDRPQFKTIHSGLLDIVEKL